MVNSAMLYKDFNKCHRPYGILVVITRSTASCSSVRVAEKYFNVPCTRQPIRERDMLFKRKIKKKKKKKKKLL